MRSNYFSCMLRFQLIVGRLQATSWPTIDFPALSLLDPRFLNRIRPLGSYFVASVFVLQGGGDGDAALGPCLPWAPVCVASCLPWSRLCPGPVSALHPCQRWPRVCPKSEECTLLILRDNPHFCRVELSTTNIMCSPARRMLPVTANLIFCFRKETIKYFSLTLNHFLDRYGCFFSLEVHSLES